MDTSRIALADMKEHVDHVMSVLNTQTDKVKNVTFLENFNKDMEMSMHYGKDIYRGLVVSLSSDYVIGEKDIAWLHPNLCLTTAMYQGGFSHSTTRLHP